MEDSTNPDFMKKMKPGDIIVAEKNFGCGSSREHAPIAIKTAGVSCVVAKSFARIFYRNCFNMGLPIFESAEAVDGISEGDEIEVDADSGVIRNLRTGKTFNATPVPFFMQELIAAGGLMAYTKKKAGL
jgi:3-isopropylmalate dehydratase small subunit